MKYILLIFLLISSLTIVLVKRENNEVTPIYIKSKSIDFKEFTQSRGDKIALLMGNNQYKFSHLKNPINDVRAIKKSLIQIGLEESNIIILEDASRSEMLEALSIFQQRATSSKIALVYFSGHGIQINEANYMFPAHTTAQSDLDIEELINLNSFISSATKANYGIILIDACRNNPLTRNFQIRGVRGSEQKGLGQVTLPPELERAIIGFATRAGEVADDGKGDNSPYAKALAKNLKFNLDIRPILSQVTRDVHRSTKDNTPPQVPIYDDTLGRESLCLTGICTGESSDIEHTKPDEVVFVEPALENIDTIGKLMYQKEPSLGRFTWSEAKKYCKNLTLKEYSNWRLPKKEELKKILNKEEIEQEEIDLWTQNKRKDGLVWAINIDDNEWYTSPTPKEWKNPSLCVKKIK